MADANDAKDAKDANDANDANDATTVNAHWFLSCFLAMRENVAVQQRQRTINYRYLIGVV